MSDPLNSLIGIHAYVFSYIKTLGDLTGKTVLDIASGDGRATNIFKAQGAKVIGKMQNQMPEEMISEREIIKK